jgi:transmembrane sensor
MSLSMPLKEAIGWRIRIRDGGDEDWDAFTQWLERDPAHSDAYDEVALIDRDLNFNREELAHALLADGLGQRIPAISHRRRGVAAWLAAAAALLLLLGAWPLLQSRSQPYEIATAAGERRMVTLEDGSRIALNGATRVRLDHANPRRAELATGEAMFTVRHDPAIPFEVESAGDTVRDVGTAFNLLREGERFEVEVTEGSVLYNPEHEKVGLAAGQVLRANGDTIVVERKPIARMAGWQKGQLSYDGASLQTVASDLSRSLGVTVVVEPRLAARTFAGSVRIDDQPERVLTTFAAALGLVAYRTEAGWSLEPGPRAPH